MTPHPWGRRGLTLTELLITMVMAAAVGAGVLKLMLGQTRSSSHQEAWRNARAVSQAGINRMVSDLRMIEALGGVEAAVAGGKDITLRVPYAMGTMCSSAGGSTVVSLAPVDSATFNSPGFSGFAYRSAAGVYTYLTAGTAVALGGAANCAAAGVATVPAIGTSPAGTVVTLTGNVATVPPVGSVFFLFRRIRYEFKASTAIPGQIGLWRTLVGPGTAEEIAAPFDGAARVRFYVDGATTAQSAVPASLATIRGLELILNGQSERAPQGSLVRARMPLTTAVFFKNRPD